MAAADVGISSSSSSGKERLAVETGVSFSKRRKENKFVRCKVCASYTSVVDLHFHHQRNPPIATVSGTRFRKEVVSDHENHHCHHSTIRAKCQKIRCSDPLSVPFYAAMKKLR